MIAHIYKSARKPDTYLYLREKDQFARVPATVMAPLGACDWVMQIELHDGRKLARADATVVRQNLEALGFYLQMPPSVLDPLVAGGVGDG
jgi:uncharacterized protein